MVEDRALVVSEEWSECERRSDADYRHGELLHEGPLTRSTMEEEKKDGCLGSDGDHEVAAAAYGSTVRHHRMRRKHHLQKEKWTKVDMS